MKILDVNPGTVSSDDGVTFAFSIRYLVVGGWTVYFDAGKHPSAAAAKQAMREKVAQERKRHGLEKVT